MTEVSGGCPEDLRGLYAITPDGLQADACLTAVESLLHGGVRWVQYRDKCKPLPQQAEEARALCALCHRYGARLIINDSLPLALTVGADGVHLGRDDGDLGAARMALGPDRLLGVSCYDDFALARQAVRSGADYVAFGAVFPSPTKPRAPLAPLSLFARCRDELGVPVCAIGGITLANAPLLISAGADLLAVITDIFKAPDPAAHAAAFAALFQGDPS